MVVIHQRLHAGDDFGEHRQPEKGGYRTHGDGGQDPRRQSPARDQGPRCYDSEAKSGGPTDLERREPFSGDMKFEAGEAVPKMTLTSVAVRTISMCKGRQPTSRR